MKLIAALAVLFAFLGWVGPFFYEGRAPVNRSQCINQIKMIGLACHEYHSAHGSFPIGTVPNPDLPLNRRLGWNYLIAPELEIRGPFNGHELEIPSDDPGLKPLQSRYALHCPADRHDPTSADYIGIAGLGLDAPTLPRNHPRAGIFGDNRVTTIDEVLDGTATTMMIAESNRPAGPWYAGGRATVRGLDPAKPPYLGPTAQFGSHHRSGANVLMADGSVRFLKESIDPKIFEAMSTIAGGETVPAEWR